MAKRILVIDDEPNIRSILSELFVSLGYMVSTVADGISGLDMAVKNSFNLIILDMSLPTLNGLDVLRDMKLVKPDVPVIMVTGYASIRSAINAIKLGAYSYITKPLDLNEVQSVCENALNQSQIIDENRYLRTQLKAMYGFDNVIGTNPSAQQAYLLATQVADTNASVLILGETGTGKEYLARAIHYQSLRAKKPFVKVSCVALPETLLESELFGHEKGSFTNAIAKRIGRFELADGGTLLLDEVGDMSQATQLKLLRVLQEKEFERVGGNETLRVDVRIIAATNRNLAQDIEKKIFRSDLYYRLNVITINLPPLRERLEDVPELAEHFLRKHVCSTGKGITGISRAALDSLRSYTWPGNIRELENCIERAVILCQGSTIMPQHLRLFEESGPILAKLPDSKHLLKPLRQVEGEYISAVLNQCGCNQTKTASILGIDRKTLFNKIKEYQLGTEIANTLIDHEKSTGQ